VKGVGYEAFQYFHFSLHLNDRKAVTQIELLCRISAREAQPVRKAPERIEY